MNRRLLILSWMVTFLILLPSMTMAQIDRVRRQPSSTGTTIQLAQPKTPKTTKTTKKSQPHTSSRPATSSAPKRATTPSSSSSSLQNITITVNEVTFTMVAVQGGTFYMGNTAEQGNDPNDDTNPVHRVTLTDFYIGETEVTQALWQAVMGYNPSYFKGLNQPVDNVSWTYCQEFITKLNQLTGRCFRLPTEAEWEYAASGGVLSRGYKFSGSNDHNSVAWWDVPTVDMKTFPVKQKSPNELGIYDMSGNVWEWCQDWYERGYYGKSPSNNPCNDTPASDRVMRGSSSYYWRGSCKVSERSHAAPNYKGWNLGLRLAL